MLLITEAIAQQFEVQCTHFRASTLLYCVGQQNFTVMHQVMQEMCIQSHRNHFVSGSGGLGTRLLEAISHTKRTITTIYSATMAP